MNKKPLGRILGVFARARARLLKAEEGATAIEYALMAGGIGVAVAATVWGVGSSLKTNFYDSLTAMF
jgi:pilus assembly protein Flp/PilA